MGRWGHRLFEGDQDIMLTIEVAKKIPHDGTEAELAWFLTGSLLNAPLGIRDFYLLEYNLESPQNNLVLATIRQKLDSGVGDELFATFRALESGSDAAFDMYQAKYRVIILAALMMRVGAKIGEDNLQHLRKLVPTIPCRELASSPMNDEGFRGPGRRQFLAALDNYHPGTLRDLLEPGCHACGKIGTDAGHALKKCGGCRNEIAAAWFCDKDCHKSLWKTHKQGNCGAPRGRGVGVCKILGKGTRRIIAYDGAQV